MDKVKGRCFHRPFALYAADRTPPDTRAGPFYERSAASDQIDHDVDVATRGFGIRARLMCGVRQGLGRFTVQPRQANIETSLQEVSALGKDQVYFSVYGRVIRDSNLHLAGSKSYRTFEAGRPASGEQLLRIGAAACAARRRELDIQPAIRAARRAIPASCGVGLTCLQYFSDLGHGWFPLKRLND
jgi:hypothetical protein